MPFVLIIVGVVLIVAAVRGKVGGDDGLVKLVHDDFIGPNNFLYWLFAILVIGAVGYIPTMEKLSRLFMALVIVTLFLSHGGFFEKFNEQAFGG